MEIRHSNTGAIQRTAWVYAILSAAVYAKIRKRTLLRRLTSSGICPFFGARVIQRVTQKRAHVLLAETRRAIVVTRRAADHGTRFFNVPDLTSSVKRRLSALTRRRFARSADRSEAGRR
jgi:hypothetical protein